MNRHLLDRGIVTEEVQVDKGDILTARILHHGFDVSVASPSQCHVEGGSVTVDRSRKSIVH